MACLIGSFWGLLLLDHGQNPDTADASPGMSLLMGNGMLNDVSETMIKTVEPKRGDKTIAQLSAL